MTQGKKQGQTGICVCLLLHPTLTVQVTCKRSSTVGHGATHAPVPGLGEAEGRDPAGPGGTRNSVPSPDEPADPGQSI